MKTALIGFSVALAASIFIAAPASAAFRISNEPTLYMSCTAGVCSALRSNAVLNVTDLKRMLATSNVTLLSGSDAQDIEIRASVDWVSANRLTLNAYRSILVKHPITVAGPGALTLSTNNGGSNGTYSFPWRGKITFWSLTSSLIINGNSYTLVGDIASLAKDIVVNPGGNFALAKDYDATPDGAYAYSPILTTFEGNFEGLGNTISNLVIHSNSPGMNVGLFSIVDISSSISNLNLKKLSIDASYRSTIGGLAAINKGTLSSDTETGQIVGREGQKSQQESVGGMAGFNYGTLTDCHASGTVDGGETVTGGLVGTNHQSIRFSSATVRVQGGVYVGGLVGYNNGFYPGIDQSFATGNVTASKLSGFYVGGLVGYSSGQISNSYSTGAVKSLVTGSFADIGGLLGAANSSGSTEIYDSYSAGHVSGGPSSQIGGFAGDAHGGGMSANYWDITLSGTSNGGCSGCLGRTTLQSHVPNNLSRFIWQRRADVNNGLPYLRANYP